MHGRVLSLAISLGLVALITASPVIQANPVETNHSGIVTRSDAERHSYVMSRWPAHLVITSAELNNSLETPQTEEQTFYLSDSHSFVTVGPPSTEAASNHTLEKRACGPVTNRKVLSSHEYWGPWHAVSSCLKSGASPSGGYLSFAIEDSVSVAYSVGLDAGPFFGILTGSFSFEITFGYSEQSTFACNVAGGLGPGLGTSRNGLG